MLQRYFWWLGFKKNKWKRWCEDEASETEPNCERPVEPGAACRNPPTCLWCRKQGVGEVAISCREPSPGLPHSFGSYNNGDSVRSAGQRPRDQWEKLQIPKRSHVCTCDWFMAKAPRQLMERGTHHGEGGMGTIGCKYEKKIVLKCLVDWKTKITKLPEGNREMCSPSWSVTQEHKAECPSHLHNSCLNLRGIVWSLQVAEHEPMQAAWPQCGFLTSLVWAAWPQTSE